MPRDFFPVLAFVKARPAPKYRTAKPEGYSVHETAGQGQIGSDALGPCESAYPRVRRLRQS